MTDKPHDRFARGLLGIREQAIAHLRAFLDPSCIETLDLETLQVVPGNLLDDRLGERVPDLLFEVGMPGRETLVYVLLEHQRRPRRRMAQRLLGCVVRL